MAMEMSRTVIVLDLAISCQDLVSGSSWAAVLDMPNVIDPGRMS